MMSKLGGSSTATQETTNENKDGSGESDSKKKKAGGISAKDIAKNPAMAKMFILAAKKFKAVQERERIEAEMKEKQAVVINSTSADRDESN